MDITNIINGCNYGSMIKTDSIDSYDKKELIETLYYSANGDDVCVDLQTLYNVNTDSQSSKGSSYEYTINSSLNDSNYMKRRGSDEHFSYTDDGDNNKPIIVYKNIYQSEPIVTYEDRIFGNMFTILILTVFIFLVMALINKSLWHQHYYVAY